MQQSMTAPMTFNKTISAEQGYPQAQQPGATVSTAEQNRRKSIEHFSHNSTLSLAESVRFLTAIRKVAQDSIFCLSW